MVQNGLIQNVYKSIIIKIRTLNLFCSVKIYRDIFKGSGLWIQFYFSLMDYCDLMDLMLYSSHVSDDRVIEYIYIFYNYMYIIPCIIY